MRDHHRTARVRRLRMLAAKYRTNDFIQQHRPARACIAVSAHECHQSAQATGLHQRIGVQEH
ncbi:MAG: hypothetical protein M1546_05800 [Chloroflexi bacterium]|nr:hypothetical protein [Chloroflexota bacterium]